VAGPGLATQGGDAAPETGYPMVVDGWEGASVADEPTIRPATPDDYDPILAVADTWWGRPVTHLLPRLFLDHFHSTSLIAEHGDDLAGFLIGFLSPSLDDEAYIHFLAVSPDHRRHGLASTLYRRFCDLARADGRRIVRAVTSPSNTTSIAFHRHLGFTLTHPDAGSPTADNYVRFAKELR
jgi:ribosomal protein S18 acetylase RimI-like enzyme